MLTANGCLERQNRFRTALSGQKIDAALLTDPRDIYYFTGKNFISHFGHPACLFLLTAGGGWVVGPSGDDVFGVDEALVYEGSNNATMNLDWTERLVALAGPKLAGAKGVSRVAWQAQTTPGLLRAALEQALHPRESVAVEPILFGVQRRKDADELETMRAAIRMDHAAYDAVEKFIEPGRTELEVLSEGIRAAQNAAGEKITHDGDYQCNSMGGPARSRKVEAGEMYVIDAWTFYHGYWSDLCRTFSVGNKPSELQESVYNHVAAAHAKIPAMFKPGAHGLDIAKATDAYIRQHPALAASGQEHHAGHGIGIRVHMEPDLNIHRDGVLVEGDCVCFEPAGYIAKERVFVRLENTYLVTKNGGVNLVEYPFRLVRK